MNIKHIKEIVYLLRNCVRHPDNDKLMRTDCLPA